METTTLTNETTLALFLRFLNEIGLPTRETVLESPTFLPGLDIRDGVLCYDPQRLLYPGDLLHEAGHIALTPAAQRASLNGNITEAHPERQGDEMAVMLWTYAACRHLNMAPEIVFHAEGYKGENEWLLENYGQGTYIGLPLLKWMGLTDEQFPAMRGWLRD